MSDFPRPGHAPEDPRAWLTDDEAAMYAAVHAGIRVDIKIRYEDDQHDHRDAWKRAHAGIASMLRTIAGLRAELHAERQKPRVVVADTISGTINM